MAPTSRLLLFPPTAILGAGIALHPRSPLSLRPTPQLCEAPNNGFLRSVLPWGIMQSRQRYMETPPPKNRSGFSPTTYRQISTGSFMGMAMGLMVARFGKSLAVMIGGVFLIIEMLARQGVDLIPFERIRTWAGNIDIRTVILENTAFKLSFGTAFIMAAWYT